MVGIIKHDLYAGRQHVVAGTLLHTQTPLQHQGQFAVFWGCRPASTGVCEHQKLRIPACLWHLPSGVLLQDARVGWGGLCGTSRLRGAADSQQVRSCGHGRHGRGRWGAHAAASGARQRAGWSRFRSAQSGLLKPCCCQSSDRAVRRVSSEEPVSSGCSCRRAAVQLECN